MATTKSPNKFKRLRKLAKMITKGFVETSYMPVRKTMSKNGLFAGQQILAEGCTRSVYQQLKKTA